MNKLLLLGMGAVVLGATTLTASAQSAPTLPSGVCIEVGYADGLRGGPSLGSFPSVWQGDAGVTFFGSGGPYDSGAVRIVNNSGSPLTLLPGAHVDSFADGSVDIHIWDGMIGVGTVIPSGGSLIMTQTTQYNFDSSDYPIQGPTSPNHGSNAEPVIHLAFAEVLGGATQDFVDATQTLNTLGYDVATYGYTFPDGTVVTNESFDWRCVDSKIVGPHVTPEPGTLALLGSGLVCFGGMVLRRRRK